MFFAKQGLGFLSAAESHTAAQSRRVALVLAGCGHRDGAEITEAVSLMISLAQHHYRVSFFASRRPAHHTLNHLTGREEGAPRSMLEEAARIARGQVAPLEELKSEDFDALVFCGGFGVAKNLCNFAFAGVDASLEADVRVPLLSFMQAGRPVVALCIAPVLVALAARELGWKDVEVTLGDGTAKDALAAAQAWGVTTVACKVDQACISRTRRIVTAPAYMIDGVGPAEIFASADAAVRGLNTLLAAPAARA